MPSTVLFPLPDEDFDVTEVAVPWKLLTRAGHDVVFATARGAAPRADPRLLEGVIFGALGAKEEPIAFYEELCRHPKFRSPSSFDELDAAHFDALHLAGGHAQGMKPYLESERLQALARDFFGARKPVSAICHGVLVLARASVLGGRRTTCLPKYMERAAYYATAWRLGRYYRTYDAYVEDEVRAALDAGGGTFERGPFTLSHGTADDDRHAFVVTDDFYVSARWPGDAYLLARTLIERLAGKDRSLANPE